MTTPDGWDGEAIVSTQHEGIRAALDANPHWTDASIPVELLRGLVDEHDALMAQLEKALGVEQ